MVEKHPIYPQRIRKVPRQFSWIDQRLVGEHYIDRCTHRSAALYLFLVTVADARGMSYYGDRSICKRLGMDEINLQKARRELVRIDLIAWQRPLYQVLAIGGDSKPCPSGNLQSLAHVLQQIGGAP
jgi:hypothetical protein